MNFTKGTFTQTIIALHEQYKFDVAIAEKLAEVYGADMVKTHDNSRLTNQLFKLLHQDFPPQNNICKIQEFAYDNNFGELSEQTISELWDELQDDIFVFPNDL